MRNGGIQRSRGKKKTPSPPGRRCPPRTGGDSATPAARAPPHQPPLTFGVKTDISREISAQKTQYRVGGSISAPILFPRNGPHGMRLISATAASGIKKWKIQQGCRFILSKRQGNHGQSSLRYTTGLWGLNSSLTFTLVQTLSNFFKSLFILQIFSRKRIWSTENLNQYLLALGQRPRALSIPVS